MLRTSLIAATLVVSACPATTQVIRPSAGSDAAVRVARAEARRAAGEAELVELATAGDVRTRTLALRGLGRTGGPRAVATLEAALVDGDARVVAAAASAIGVLASLHEPDGWSASAALIPALAAAAPSARPAIVEALGRAGDVLAQPALARCTTERGLAAACALALGRHGRRRLALTPDARGSLVAAAASADPDVRRAATYALAREHAPPAADPAATAALAAAIADPAWEVRSTAIAGLGRRGAIDQARANVEASLLDRDWRVAVEAARALAAVDDAGRLRVAEALLRRWPALAAGATGEAHVLGEALRALASAGQSAGPHAGPIAQLAALAAADARVAPLSRGWIQCLAVLAAPPTRAVAALSTCPLPDHLRLPLLGELASRASTDPDTRRAALGVLLGHADARVRAAGIGATAAAWKDGDALVRARLLEAVTSALATGGPIVAGAAIDAAVALLERDETAALDPGTRAALERAITRRATTETDVELSASLLGAIGARGLASGAEACRGALGGPPVRARAGRACLLALGAAPPVEPSVEPPVAPPPGDVAGVIGHRVTWELVTSRGAISIELRPDVAPWAVTSVVALTRRGFYDGLELHRVVPGFVAQGGDPTMSGWGGPGYLLPAEPSGSADGAGFTTGGIGMADAGPDSAGSQWFVMHAPAPHLDGRYTWIGAVTRGQPVADSLQIGDRIVRATVTID